MKTIIIDRIKAEIKVVSRDSGHDEAAAEWHCHLEEVLNDLQSDKMTVEEAARSLGMSL